jgi:hypothetical protein
MRPLELLFLAGVAWWSLNRSSAYEEITRLSGSYEGSEADPKWNVLKTVILALGVLIGYLVILTIMFSVLEPQGLRWTLATAATGLAAGTAAFLVVNWAGRRGFTGLLGKKEIDPSERQ